MCAKRGEGSWASGNSQALAAEVEHKTRYSLRSFGGDVHRFASSVRSHWGSENCVQWALDGAFRLR
jgi:hypothetical protein